MGPMGPLEINTACHKGGKERMIDDFYVCDNAKIQNSFTLYNTVVTVQQEKYKTSSRNVQEIPNQSWDVLLDTAAPFVQRNHL
jgi:hypothetical protein